MKSTIQQEIESIRKKSVPIVNNMDTGIYKNDNFRGNRPTHWFPYISKIIPIEKKNI